MENLILQLLITDNEKIQQATQILREKFKDPQNTTKELCEVMTTSQNPQVKQYSTLLLRKRFAKAKHWNALPQPMKEEFKAIIIQVLMQEQEKTIISGIAQLAGTIAKHELSKNNWPQILEFLSHLFTNQGNQELGLLLLATMTDISPDAFQAHLRTIMELLNSVPMSTYVVEILRNLTSLIEGNQLMVDGYHHMVPKVMQMIQASPVLDQEITLKVFDLFDELSESAVVVIAPHIKNLIEMYLCIANNPNVEEDIRLKAVVFIGWLAKIKKKAVIKHKLVEPIIDMLFSYISMKPQNEDLEIYFTDEDDNTPVTSAVQTLDLLALHLPPDKLVPYLLKHIEPALESNDIYKIKASFLSMAVLAEGCSEYIKSKYLEEFLKCICTGIAYTNVVVKNAAYFALGQFSEHLQPDISSYADNILPMLFQHLGQLTIQTRAEKKDIPSADRMFYAFEIFAENLNEGLLPYLPQLMSLLFEILSDDNSPIHMRELALSAIGAAAQASKENMLPYFDKIMEILQGYLSTSKPTEENAALVTQAVDTFGVLARTIGEANFEPIALKSLDVAMFLLRETEDPDLKKSLYGLIASISSVLKERMHFVLVPIVEYLIASVQSSEGINACYKDEDSDYLVYDDACDSDKDEVDIEISDSEDADDEDVSGYDVENAYIEEKEEAVLALKEIAEYTGEAFLPFLEKSFEEVLKLINYPQDDVKRAAIDALTQFTINFSKPDTPWGKAQAQKALAVLIPKFSEIIRLDEERAVAVEALDACAELLEHVKQDCLVNAGHKEAFINCVLAVLQGQTACQDVDGAEQEDDGGEAEHDEYLIECSGPVLINLFKCLPPNECSAYMRVMLPNLIKRTKKSYSQSQRSFAIGTILECLPPMANYVAEYVSVLLPLFIKNTNDSFDEIRSNCIFGIGELALHGKEATYPHYNQILQLLSNLLSKESHAGARDNIIGAIARLIIANYQIIPMDQVFPPFIEHLPLKEDTSENITSFKCINHLYKIGHETIKMHLDRLLEIAANLIQQNDIDDELKALINEFLISVQRDFPDNWNAFCSTYFPSGFPVQLTANI